MIQDIYPSKLKNEYDKAAVAENNDTVMSFCGNEILCRLAENAEIVYPKVADLKIDESGTEPEFTYLFALNEERFFLTQTEIKAPEGYQYMDIRAVRDKKAGPKERMFVLYTGKHLRDWYRDNRYCGRCGKKMIHSKTERAMKCEDCGNRSYPRIMPAVIVGVKNGDTILLTKYRTGFSQFALVAGFTEIGETAEETVAREVMEETGVKVKNIRYYKSQPWGSANDLLLGFYCEVDGDPTIRMDDNELKFAEWVKRENIILQTDDYSLTNEMMRQFKEGKEI